MYNKARSCFWIEKELDLSKDKYDWDNKLNDDERFFLSNILAFLISIFIQLLFHKS